jgi:acyl-CoA synthetase (AMP-forming)/AMP-acid ligase II
LIIADLIRRSCAQHAPRVAVQHRDQTQTYAQLWDRSVRLVNGLRALGLRPGDRVATLAPNSLTTLEAMTGLAIGGYVRTALHGMNAADAHAHMLANAEVKALITTAELYRQFADTFAGIAGLEHIIVQDAPDATQDYESMLAAAESHDPEVPVAGDTLLHLAYSSGASGRPKASMHSHQSWMNVTTDHALMLPRLTDADTYLAAAPLTHAASTVIYALLARGARVLVMEHFDAGLALELIERERCTVTVMVPTMLQLIVNHDAASSLDLSSLRAVLYAGAPISPATARGARDLLGDVLFQTYGQSECLPATCLTPEDHAEGASSNATLLRSAGRPCLNSSVRVLDDDGNDVRGTGIGEIAIHTPGRMIGIYGDPAATSARLTPDGYVRTRDSGYLDERGYLYVVDRKDDMIISGGFNIWPVEIENALGQHAAVEDVVVVAVPHAKWGETPHAVVRLREHAVATEQELIDFCRERLGSMKKPTAIAFTPDPFPRSELGKLQRRAIRDQFWPAERVDARNVTGA